jgi:phage terminase large subunit-like protein
VPEGNGKTTFMAAWRLYYGDYKPSAMVPIGASSREQAEILYRQAEGFVLRTKGLRERFKCQEGYRRIKCLRTGGRIQVFAADDRTGDGIIPTAGADRRAPPPPRPPAVPDVEGQARRSAAASS